jgi:hypothetical protein
MRDSEQKNSTQYKSVTFWGTVWCMIRRVMHTRTTAAVLYNSGGIIILMQLVSTARTQSAKKSS